jgi:hypothetical protein
LDASAPTRYLHIYALIIANTPNLLTQSKTQKAQSLEDILLEFRPITGVYYKSFKCVLKQTARVFLPLSFPQNLYLFDYFSLFFTHDLFRIITTNTNRYTSIQRLYIPQEKARE